MSEIKIKNKDRIKQLTVYCPYEVWFELKTMVRDEKIKSINNLIVGMLKDKISEEKARL